MAEPLVPDELWEAVAPLLPRHKARPGKRGRPPVDDRACLTGIVFVLRSGIPWELLPQEMGCGSGVTCWRRLRYWQRRGVWKKLLHSLLQRGKRPVKPVLTPSPWRAQGHGATGG
jgi:transposase